MTKILELLELIDQYGMTEMQIRRCRVKTSLDFQWMTLLQFFDKLIFNEDLISTSADNI